MMKRNLMLLALLAMALIVLAACTGTPDTEDDDVGQSETDAEPTAAEVNAEPPPDEQEEDGAVDGEAAEAEAEAVTLTFWFEGEAPATVTIFEEAMSRFEEMHPGVTIDVLPMPFEDMVRTMPLALDGGTGPDVATVPPVAVGTWLYAEAGHLVDFTDIAAEGGWLENFDERAIEINNAPFEGRVYGIPYEWTGVGVYYNQAIFDELGLTPPETMAAFEEIMAATRDAGYLPVSVGALDAWPLQHVWSQLAHTNMPYDGLLALEELDPEASYNVPELIEAGEKIVEWTEQGYLDPNMLSTSFVDANNLFINGEAAMNIGGTWVQADFRQAGFPVGFFRTPPMNPDLPYHMGGFTPYDDLVVVAASENRELAVELVGYLISEENMRFFWEEGLLVPYQFAEIPEARDQLQVDIFTAMQASGPGHYEGNCCPEVQQTIWVKMQEMVSGDVTPEQAFVDIQEVYEEFRAAESE